MKLLLLLLSLLLLKSSLLTIIDLTGWLMFMLGKEGVANGKIRDAEILVRNPSPRLFGKKFRDSKEVNTNHAKMRLQDLSKTLPRFRDPAKIFRDPRFSRYHSPPLKESRLLVANE